MSNKKTTVLCIMDGFGLNPDPYGNAVEQAATPVFDSLWSSDLPKATLLTHGERVGLPPGQMGNSEVGHLNIGAGRVVDQWLLRITKDLKANNHETSRQFVDFTNACATAGQIHLIGLLSDGGVHSHEEHLFTLIPSLLKNTTCQITLHIITDGRDTSPTSGIESVRKLEKLVADENRVKIGSVQGRFFAMDRDKRWERVEMAYRAIAEGKGHIAKSASSWLEKSYKEDITDEFIEPAIVTSSPVQAGDAFLFWNYRADRMREIVSALCISDFTHFERHAVIPEREKTLCFTEYESTFHLPALFSPIKIDNFLGQVVADAGKTQLRTAETEKYPHVTYFLNGGSELHLEGEKRELIQSPRDVKTYDEKPEMSAEGVCSVVLSAIDSGEFELIVVNFANCDMVGHTGVLEAAVKAVQVVDTCLGKIVESVKAHDGNMIVIADHGNAEQMLKPDGKPHTAHTTFPVPMIVIGAKEGSKLQNDGALCDVAPTVLRLMNLDAPDEMSGKCLLTS